jgi:hypothetical protein
MSDLTFVAEAAFADMVELFVASGALAPGSECGRAVFDRVNVILWGRLCQLEERVLSRMRAEVQKAVASERAERFATFTEPSQS